MIPEGTPWIPNNNCSPDRNCRSGKKNPLWTKERLDYELFFWERLRISASAQFMFNYESDFIDPFALSTMLYDYGYVCFFIDDIIGLVAMPCMILRRSVAGKPVKVKCYSPYNVGYTVVLDKLNGDDFYVCWDCITKIEPKMFFIPWINEMAEISVTMRVNTFSLRTPIITVSTTGERLAVENIMQQYMDGKYIIELKDTKGKKKPADVNDDNDDLSKRIKVLDLTPPYNLDKLDTQRNAIWNRIMETLGFKVNTAPFKKERAITSEVEGNAEPTAAFYWARKRPRLDALEWIHNHGYENVQLLESTKTEDVMYTLGNVKKEDASNVTE